MPAFWAVLLGCFSLTFRSLRFNHRKNVSIENAGWQRGVGVFGLMHVYVWGFFPLLFLLLKDSCKRIFQKDISVQCASTGMQGITFEAQPFRISAA